MQCEDKQKSNLIELKEFSTKELVEELSLRIGVARTDAEPYQDKTITVNGPAVVLVITD